MLHRGLFASSEVEMHFPSSTFVLTGAWANQHNSRQGCNLDELTNQSEPTHDLASAQGTRIMRKRARIVTGVFEAWHSHVGAKRCYGSKISKGGFIKVMIGIAEQQESVIRQCAFLMAERGERVYHVIQRSSRRFQGYTHAIEESKV
jgi:hypothetical protein